MTTVVEVLNRIARECSVAAPSSWVSATGATHVQIRDDFLVETIDDLCKRVNWPSPIGKQTTIAGDGSEDYDLPSDFLALQFGETAVYETTTTRRWGVPVATDGEWTQLKTIGTGGTNRYYRVKGYDGNWQISLYPNPATGSSITVSYVSKNWMASAAGTAGDTFTAEDDVILFPRRPVELGTIYRWRRQKGFEYAHAQAEYEAWIATTSNRANGRNVIGFGGRETEKPMRVPVPDFIPSS